jgi:hypothetical protein
MAGEHAPNTTDNHELLGLQLANAILTEELGKATTELGAQQKLTLLKELEGRPLRLTAPAKDKENTETKFIESYSREEDGEETNWLPPDEYMVGELDVTDPDNPMLFVHHPDEAKHVRYFVYVNDLRLIDDQTNGAASPAVQ